MCGYCLEIPMFQLLEAEYRTKAPVSQEQVGKILLEHYAQESNFLLHCLKYSRESGMQDQLLYILHCRALEEIISRPWTALQDSLALAALTKHYHAYKRLFAPRFQSSAEQEILPHQSWAVLLDPNFIFESNRWSALLDRRELLHESALLLEHYHSWWLQGEDQKKNNLHQRLQETGVMDPIEDITSSEWEKFYNLFPALYFALIYLGKHCPNSWLLQNIALTPPSGVPDFPGFDLWLRRKALIFVIQAQGTEFLLDNLGSNLSLDLMYYTILKLNKVRSQKQRIISRLQDLEMKGPDICSNPEEVQEYIERIRNCPEPLGYQ